MKKSLLVFGIVAALAMSGCGLKNRMAERNFVSNITKTEIPYNIKNTQGTSSEIDSVYLQNKARIKEYYTYLDSKYGGYTTEEFSGTLTTRKKGDAKLRLTLNKLEELYNLNELYYANKNTSGILEVQNFIANLKRK